MRAIQATNPDIVFVGSYPLDSVGMVLAAQELDLKTKAFGGAMVGLQSTVFKTKLGEALNGVINYDYWLPAPSYMRPGVAEFLAKYQARAGAEGVDPLGYYMAPFAYADMQLMEQAITATSSLDDGKIADHLRTATHKTLIGDVKFGDGGEWEKDRQLLVQFRGVKGNGLDQFRGVDVQPILYPAETKTGTAVPFNEARKK